MEEIREYLYAQRLIEENKKEIIFKSKNHYLLTKERLKQDFFKPRNRFTHKGDYGHALLIAGSKNKAGACILSARAALRTGAGLLSVHIPHALYDILQISVPEAMTQLDKDKSVFTSIIDTDKYSAVAVGPGLDTKNETKEALIYLLKTNIKPVVIDADGLNTLSTIKDFQQNIKSKNVVLTPHPKEFERLFGKFKTWNEKLDFMSEFSRQNAIIIVLKDAITTISNEKGEIFFNILGNAGMATGGSGDVLTGIILGLLSQGYSAEDSAKLGVYIHALGGDKAAEYFGEKSLIASDIISNICKAIEFLSKK